MTCADISRGTKPWRWGDWCFYKSKMLTLLRWPVCTGVFGGALIPTIIRGVATVLTPSLDFARQRLRPWSVTVGLRTSDQSIDEPDSRATLSAVLGYAAGYAYRTVELRNLIWYPAWADAGFILIRTILGPYRRSQSRSPSHSPGAGAVPVRSNRAVPDRGLQA
jgi:hypothetical protein